VALRSCILAGTKECGDRGEYRRTHLESDAPNQPQRAEMLRKGHEKGLKTVLLGYAAV